MLLAEAAEVAQTYRSDFIHTEKLAADSGEESATVKRSRVGKARSGAALRAVIFARMSPQAKSHFIETLTSRHRIVIFPSS
jgi:magnesium-transporting ATPase (P-type)